MSDRRIESLIMRICLVAAHYPPDIDGMGDYTHFLACAIAQMGHDAHVVTSTGKRDEQLYPVPDGLLVHRVIRGWTLAQLPRIVIAIRKLQPDAVVLQYTPQAYDRRGITLAINLVPFFLRITTGAL